MSDNFKIAQKRRGRAFWPAIGFLLAVSIAILAYVVAPAVIDWVDDTFREFSRQGLTDQELRLAFAAIIWTILMSVVVLIIAVFTPKRMSIVKDSDVAKDREEAARRKKADRLRQRRLNQEMRRQNQSNQGRR
ncbi:MAG: hypothetical protein GYB67_11495 [Chloroflexi bacterium]|nr:hypothetical protein [Chloroflexota bacterium]